MGEGGREGGEGCGQLLVLVREVFASISAYSSCINEEKVTNLTSHCPDDNWSIQLYCRQVIFRAQVGNR